MPLSEVCEQGVTDRTTDKTLFESVMSLPPKYSTVIYLFYYEDLKITEIAEILGVSQSTVKSRLVRSRNKLKQIIEKENSYD